MQKMKALSGAITALFVAIAIQMPSSVNAAPAVTPPLLSFMAPKVEEEQAKLLQNEVKQAWDAADYKKLEMLGVAMASGGLKSASGRPMLSIYTGGLTAQNKIAWDSKLNLRKTGPGECQCEIPDPKYYAQANKLWDVVGARYDAWLKAAPNSPFAIVAKAQYYVSRAWFFRGSAPASTIPPQALPLMSASLEAARTLLFNTYKISSRNPGWYLVMFTIAGTEGWQRDDMNKLISDFMEHGQGYLAAASRAIKVLQPQWGGSYDLMDKFAVAMSTKYPQPGVEMYTRLYWAAYDGQRKLFTDTRASWPRMRTEFDEMIRMYSDPVNLNVYAYFACVAADYKTEAVLIDKIGKDVIPAVWEDGSFDWCKKKAGR